jgi:hypothetical protein
MRDLLPSLLLLICPLMMFAMMYVMHRRPAGDGDGTRHARRGEASDRELESLQIERDRLAARVELLEVKLEELEKDLALASTSATAQLRS